MKAIGIFEAKTKFSEVCELVAESHEAITVTKRGKPLVRIVPIDSDVLTIRERREAYMAGPGKDDMPDTEDFEPPERSSDVSNFAIEE
ncbi:MAG: type II toxin-antitoxin system Phd/YefM family antitoxin [Verrucomicrobia bacterium]|nr:type II toxin-antitoxin system Phd/YefM family antitoxin [Verrucomicrobiota bacterium]